MKILKLAILISFLFNSFAYPSDNLRVPMMGNKANNKDRLESAGKPASGETMSPGSPSEAYAKIKDLLDTATRSMHYIKVDIIEELRSGKVIFKTVYEAASSAMTDQIVKSTIDLRHGVVYQVDSGKIVTTGPEYTIYFDPYMKHSTHEIGKDVLKLVTEQLGVTVKPLSENGLKVVKYEIGDLITSRARLLLLGRTSKMTGEDIGRCLRSLAKDAKSPKAAITKKLQKLQRKRPETVAIIREKALELLEIDETNFRDGLQPFIGDYIKIRDTIRQAGAEDTSAIFYSLFDKIVAISKQKVDIWYALKYIIPAAAKAAQTPQELQDICTALFNLILKLAENGISPEEAFFVNKDKYSFILNMKLDPETLKAGRDKIEEVIIKEVAKKAGPHIIATTTSFFYPWLHRDGPYEEITIERAIEDAEFLKDKTFADKAVDFQNRYGGFSIVYTYIPEKTGKFEESSSRMWPDDPYDTMGGLEHTAYFTLIKTIEDEVNRISIEPFAIDLSSAEKMRALFLDDKLIKILVGKELVSMQEVRSEI